MATTVSRLEVQVGADISQAVGGLAAVNTGIETMGRQSLVQAAHFSRLGFLLGGVGAALAGAGKAGLGFFKESIDASIEYGRQAALTFTQVDKGKATLEDIRRIGRDVARDIPAPFEEMQASLFDIFSSMDVGAKQAEGLLRNFARGAVAGQTDIQTAGRATIAIMNGFKIPVEQVSDVMDVQFQIVRKGVITYDEFAKTIGRAIPSANRAGATIQDLGGMMAFLTRNGLSAAMAATSSARAFDLISNPKFATAMGTLGLKVSDADGKFKSMTQIVSELRNRFQGLSGAEQTMKVLEISGEDATEALEKFGIKIKDAEGNMRPLKDLSKELEARFKGMSEVQVSQMLAGLTSGAGGTIQAMRFLNLAITDSNGLFPELTKNMYNAKNAAGEAYKTMEQTPAMQIQLLKNNWALLREEIGGMLAPQLMKLVEVGTKLVKWFNDLNPRLKTALVMVGFFGSAALVVIGTVGIAAGSLLALAAAFSLMGVASGGAALALSVGFMGAIIAIPAAIIAVVANWDTLMGRFEEGDGRIQRIGEIFTTVFDGMKEAWRDLVNVFETEGFTGALQQIPTFLTGIATSFTDNLPRLIDTVSEWFNNAVKNVDWGGVGRTIGSFVGEMIAGIANFAVDIASGLLRLMGEIDWFAVGVGAAVFIAEFIRGAVSAVFSSGLLGNLGNMITENLKPIAIAALVMGLAPAGLQNFIIAALGRLPLVGAIAGKIANVFSLASTLALGPIGRTTHLLGTKFMTMLAASLTGATAILARVGTAIATAFTAIGSSAVTVMSGPFGWVISAVALAGLLIIANWDKVGPFFKGLWAEVQTIFTDFWGNLWPFIQQWWPQILGIFTGGIGTLIGEIIQNWETIREWFGKLPEMASEAVTAVGDWFGRLPGTIGGFMGDVISTVVNFFAQLPGKVLGLLGTLGTAMINWIPFAIGWAIGFTLRVGIEIFKFFIELPGKILGFLGDLIVAGRDWLFGTAIPWAAETGLRITIAIIDFFAKLPGRIRDFLVNVVIGIAEFGARALIAAQNFGGRAVAAIVDFFQRLPGRTREFFTNAVTEIINFGAKAGASAVIFGQKVLNGVVEFVQKIPGRVADFFRSIPGFIEKAIGNIWEVAKRIAGRFVDGFKKGLFGSPRTRMEYMMLDAFDRMRDDTKSFTDSFQKMEPIEFKLRKTALVQTVISGAPPNTPPDDSVNPGARGRPGGPDDGASGAMLNIENVNITSQRPEEIVPDFMDEAGWLMATTIRGRG